MAILVGVFFSWILAIIKVMQLYNKNRRILREFGWNMAKIRPRVFKPFVWEVKTASH